MSLKVIREQVLKFISQSSPSVIAIKGEWGVGKTHGWEALLSEAKRSNMISGKRYSYVSLFGISSLDKLKYSLFENSIQQDSIGHEPSLDSLRKNTIGMLEVLGRGSWSKIKDVPLLKSAAPAVEAFSFMSVSDYLICIDDLERKGAALDLKDVLGLVSLMKEKKGCKIVLLLNSGTGETDDYEKYKEKVIDIELDFSPTPIESAEVAYDKSKEYHDELSAFTISLGIKNIRVLTKIERYIEIALPHFRNAEPEIKTQLLQSTALFSWAYYCSSHDTDIPTLDFIESFGGLHYFDEKKLPDREKLWRSTLMSYNFYTIDDLDRQIAKLVRSGYIEIDKLMSTVSKRNQQEIANKKHNSYKSAWDRFHNSFSDDQDEVMELLHDSFMKNLDILNPGDLNSLVTILRDFGEDQKASDVIGSYIQQRKANLEIFNVEDFSISRLVTDVEIIERFKDVYRDEKPKRTIKDVLEKISGQNGWGNDDEQILYEATEDDYYKYFKGLNGEHLTSHVSTCLKFGDFGNGTERMNAIANKSKEALKRIAKESKINELRMKKFNL